ERTAWVIVGIPPSESEDYRRSRPWGPVAMPWLRGTRHNAAMPMPRAACLPLIACLLCAASIADAAPQAVAPRESTDSFDDPRGRRTAGRGTPVGTGEFRRPLPNGA